MIDCNRPYCIYEQTVIEFGSDFQCARLGKAGTGKAILLSERNFYLFQENFVAHWGRKAFPSFKKLLHLQSRNCSRTETVFLILRDVLVCCDQEICSWCEGESDCFKEMFPQQCICRQYTGCKPEYAVIYNCTTSWTELEDFSSCFQVSKAYFDLSCNSKLSAWYTNQSYWLQHAVQSK